MSNESDVPTPPRIQIDQSDGITEATFPRHHTDGVCVRELYEFAAELSEQTDAKLLVDMQGLPMVTSGMAGILVQIQKMFRHTGAQLAVVVADELMFMQFKAMHMNQLLQLFHSREEAVAAFK